MYVSVVHKAYFQRIFGKRSISCCRNGVLRTNAEVNSALTLWLSCHPILNTTRVHPLGSHGIPVTPLMVSYSTHSGYSTNVSFQLQNNITAFPLTILPFPVHLKNNTCKTEIYSAWLTLWKDPSIFFKKEKKLYIYMYKPTPKILTFKNCFTFK